MKDVNNLTRSALATGLVIIFTSIFSIPSIVNGGYINLGDLIIFIICIKTNLLIATASAAVGSALSDIILGFTMYAPFSFIIKGIMALVISYAYKNTNSKHCIFIGIVLMVVGYFISDLILVDYTFALSNILGNSFQGIVCSLAALAILKKFPKSIDI